MRKVLISLTCAVVLVASVVWSPVAFAQDDLDIAKLRVTKHVNLDRPRPVRIKMMVVGSTVPTTAVVRGTQAGVEIYNESMVISGAAKGRETWEFPSYTPTAMGDIIWVAEIFDSNPDEDIAWAITDLR